MKRIAAIMIASLFVLTAFAVLEMPTAMASTPTQDFSFPYSYGQPQVPSDVGAQGIVGPTVPLSDIGITEPIGAQGTQGPSYQYLFVKIPIIFNVTVYNGTSLSHSPSVHALVTLMNATTGNSIQGYTDTSGDISLSTYSGHQWLTVTQPNGVINFTEFVSTGQTSSVVYLLPSSYSSKTIDNGPLSNDTATLAISPQNVYVKGASTFLGMYQQLNVTVWNNTGNKLLTYVATGSNATAMLYGLNTLYSYNFTINGAIQPLTGIHYPFVNQLISSDFTLPSGFSRSTPGSIADTATTMHGGTISGSPLPGTNPSYGEWELSQNTYINSSTIWIGAPVLLNGYTLSFNDDTIFYNATPTGISGSGNGRLLVSNSTFISYSTFSIQMESGTSVFNHSNIFGSIMNDTTYLAALGNASFPYQAGLPSYLNHSNVEDVMFSGSFPESPQWSNDTLNWINSSNGGGNGISLTGFKYVTMNNTYDLQFDPNGNISYSIISNSTLNRNGKPGTTNFYQDFIGRGFTWIELANGLTFNHVVINITYQYGKTPNSYPRGWAYPTPFSMGNFTYSVWESSAPSIQGFYVYPDANVSNDIFNFSDSMSAVGYWSSNTRYTSDLASMSSVGGMGFHGSGNRITHNLFYLQNQGPWTFGNGAVIANNEFLNQWVEEGTLQGMGNNDVIENNTFEGNYINWSFINETSDYFSGYQPLQTIMGGTNLTLMYNSFYSRANMAYLVDSGLKIAKYNVFYNDQSSGPNYTANYRVKFGGTDIIDTQSGIVSDNYFLNLNQWSVTPIITDSGTDVNISGNHYYVSPFVGAFVPLTNSSTNRNVYEDDIGATSVVSISGGTYTYNSTYTLPPLYSGFPMVYRYIFVPDVNTLSGTPTISYSNGLVGGPQPNFTWDGYKYTESVEPSYIQVGVNSANAPPVNLQFNGAPNTAYSIAMYDHGQLIDYTNVTSSANGVVTFTYNPATMPLDPVFELTTFHIVTSGSTAVPPEVFLYVLLAGGALLGAGAIIVAAVDRRRYR